MISKSRHGLLAVIVVAFAATNATAAIIYESGTLGTTGLPQGSVPGTNIKDTVFTGVRFHLNQPVMTSQVGGHFVAQSSGTFFGAIVELDDENDFPDSDDLSSPDVLGHTLLTFPALSDEVFGDLSLSLDPGWYTLVFGSGLFVATAIGSAIRNNTDIGDPSYIGNGQNLGWFNLDIFQNPFEDQRFVIKGRIIPEPSSDLMLLMVIVSSLFLRVPIKPEILV